MDLLASMMNTVTTTLFGVNIVDEAPVPVVPGWERTEGRRYPRKVEAVVEKEYVYPTKFERARESQRRGERRTPR